MELHNSVFLQTSRYAKPKLKGDLHEGKSKDSWPHIGGLGECGRNSKPNSAAATVKCDVCTGALSRSRSTPERSVPEC